MVYISHESLLDSDHKLRILWEKAIHLHFIHNISQNKEQTHVESFHLNIYCISQKKKKKILKNKNKNPRERVSSNSLDSDY